MSRTVLKFFAPLMAVTVASALWTGCDLNSGDSTVRNLGINFSGTYANNGSRLVSNNSGAAITSLSLRQNGDNLEAVDNNGRIFRGSISRLSDDGQAAFTLRGTTTAGQEGVISGSLISSGSTANMTGTWAEPGQFGSVSGSASIVGDVGGGDGDGDGNGDDGDGNGDGDPDLAVSPSGVITLGVGFSRTFTASGGSGTYAWSLSDAGIGSLSSTSGTSISYTASVIGQQVVTVSDGSSTESTTVDQT